MGHIRLGVLPKSKKWNRVVEELRLGADVSEIASATAAAAETSLENASADPAFLHAFWLLTQIPLAARGPEFIEDLRRLGVTVSVPPGLMDLLAGFSAAVDQNALARAAELTWARWRRWLPSKAWRRWSARCYLRCLGRRPKK